MKILLTLVFALSLTNLAYAQRTTRPVKPAAKEQTLDEKIKGEVADFKGKVWIYAKNLDTGKDYALRADEQTRTASTIKLAIMAEAFRQVSEGKVKWDDSIELTKEKKQGGSGILFEFTDGTKIDLKTAVHLMIVVSDNTATNLVLDKITADSVNDLMDTLGLGDIRSMRKIGGGGDAKAWADPQNKLFGLGRSSPRQMVKLIEMMERGQVVSTGASAEMIAILKRQQFKDGIGRGQSDTTPVASKSGALDRFRADVGIVYTRRGRIAMAIYIDDMPYTGYHQENPGLHMIWKLSEILQDGLGR
jgi:beta-lactamase class A